MTYDTWRPMETVPKGLNTFVLLLMGDGNIIYASNDGDPNTDHNGWWTQDGLDLGYGFEDPIGWLPRDALPRTPT